MSNQFSAIDRYLDRRAIRGPWRIEGRTRDGLRGAVVIPALAEEESLGATLQSLAANPEEILAGFLVLVVVNHREDAAAADREANRRTLGRLAGGDWNFPGLQLAWIDAASPGRELPSRDGGVGLARRIGFDRALERLGREGGDSLLVSLDADTLVDPDYLQTLLEHFDKNRTGAAVVPFRHQPGRTKAEDRAIRTYELYLRSYVFGLFLAGSPYAFHTIGSTIACRAESYVRAGGMNRRRAGEDFYFLQQLAKTSGVTTLQGTVVRPSARPSGRTPFGTGRSVTELLAGHDGALRFYPPAAFRALGSWLDLVSDEWQRGAEWLLRGAGERSATLAASLRDLDFPSVWSGLQHNHRRQERFLHGFHVWFDGLRTRQLLRRLHEATPAMPAAEAVSGLLEWGGIGPSNDEDCQLALLRRHQGA